MWTLGCVANNGEMSGNYDEDNDNNSMMMRMMMMLMMILRMMMMMMMILRMMMTLQKTQKVGSFFPLRLIGLLPRNPGGKN